jgi:phosphoglycolate phosphatase-like HAD superfamily hydrolase
MQSSLWQEAVARQRRFDYRLATPVAVLFDLDGTLVDTMQTFADVAATVIEETHGIDWASAREAYLATSGIPFFQQLKLIAPNDARNALAVERFEREKLTATEGVGANESTVVALRRLGMRGIRVAVSSNNFQEQVDKFVETCRAPFDLALGFGTDGFAKGEPHFDKACSQFECTRDDIVFVGDSLADAALAVDAGVRFVGRLGTFSVEQFRAVVPHAALIDEIDELLALFAS